MKIALLSPIAWRTPPLKYGPWEQVTSNIMEGLIDHGIDVTLFATGNSSTKGKLEYISETAYAENQNLEPKVWECLHISNLMEQAHKYNLIHNNFDFLPLTYSKLINTPMLTTIHRFSSPKILPVYKKYNNTSYYVSISNSDRSSELDYLATIYNGIDLNDFTFCEQPKDYLLFFGRIHPEKGTHEAILIAKKAKRQLLISGLIQDHEYFEKKVKPYINDDDIVFLGNSGSTARNKLLGEAYAMLHPISFNEPFGLSVAESMICGTPVIAFNKGSMPELIENEKTGFLVKNIDEAVHVIADIKLLNRLYCSQRSSARFSKTKMVEEYIKVYNQIAQ